MRCPDLWLSSSVSVAAELSGSPCSGPSVCASSSASPAGSSSGSAPHTSCHLVQSPLTRRSRCGPCSLARTIAWLAQPRRARAERWSGRSGRGLETARPSALVKSLSRLGLCALLVKSLGSRDAHAPGGKAGARQARPACSDDEPTTNAWQRPDQVFELQFVGRACRFVRLSGCVVRPSGGRCAAASLEIWVRSRTACSTTISPSRHGRHYALRCARARIRLVRLGGGYGRCGGLRATPLCFGSLVRAAGRAFALLGFPTSGLVLGSRGRWALSRRSRWRS